MVFSDVPDEASAQAACAVEGSPDAQLDIHLFQGSRRDVIQLVVGLLSRLACPEIKIWLIPDLEIPARDLFDSVPVYQVLREMADEVFPFRQSLGGETMGRYQNECTICCAASFPGIKLNSTNGRTPF